MKNLTSKENRRHSSPLKPFSYYKSNIPEYFANVPLHWHHEFEINYIWEGTGDFICGNDRFLAQQGDLILIQPNMLHAVYPKRNEVCIYDTLLFSSSMIRSFDMDRSYMDFLLPLINGTIKLPNHITRSHSCYNEFRSLAETVFDCAKENTSKLDVLMKSELLRLFWLLDNYAGPFQKDHHESARSENIRPAIEYMNDHFTDTISIEQLACISHLSKSYFMSSFKQVSGVGAIEYITHLRMKSACEQLSGSNKSISEIAFSCGFRNLSNFNRQFKSIMGYTPSQYRKNIFPG